MEPPAVNFGSTYSRLAWSTHCKLTSYENEFLIAQYHSLSVVIQAMSKLG